MKTSYSLLTILTTILLCTTAQAQQQQPADYGGKYIKRYQKAIINSAYTANSKIWDGLIQINDANKNLKDTMINGERYILTVTWKSTNFYKKENLPQAQLQSSGPYDLWVTIAPQLKERMHKVKPAKAELRLEQMLGLPPYKGYYKLFFEFWVRPQDLYRPCADNEITDNACQLAFPANVQPSFVAWIDSQRIGRFFVPDTASRYPWTELGYTYDWNCKNKSHHGCSEFVVKQNSNMYQRRFYTTEEYLYGN